MFIKIASLQLEKIEGLMHPKVAELIRKIGELNQELPLVVDYVSLEGEFEFKVDCVYLDKEVRLSPMSGDQSFCVAVNMMFDCGATDRGWSGDFSCRYFFTSSVETAVKELKWMLAQIQADHVKNLSKHFS